MAFWTEGKGEPTRKYRFLISADGTGDLTGNWWWAKSVGKPSFDINHTSYQLGNYKFKYPGVLTWNDIQMTLIDVDGKTKDLLSNLTMMGYEVPLGSPGPGIGKNQVNSIKQVRIQQLDSAGETIENWVLYNVMITQMNFGDLSYSDDELVEIQLTLVYDYAQLT